VGRVVAIAALLAGVAVAAGAVFGSNNSAAPTASTEVAATDSLATDSPATDTTATAATEAVATPAASVASLLGEAPPILGVEAELTNLDGWLQSDIDSLADLNGKVHIVQFWTFGCYNCKNTLPALIDINDTYGGDDFEIVGVHAPEFDYEKDPDAILAAAEKLNVTWPIALDTNKKNFRSWQESRRFWPRTYVVDQNGDIRFDRIGEGAYDKLEQTVAWLLENGPGDGTEADTTS